MARIYSVLVLFALVLLASNIILGYVVGDWNGLVQRRVEVKKKTDQLKREVNISKHRLQMIQVGRVPDGDASVARAALQEAEDQLAQQYQEQALLIKHFTVVRDLQTIHFLLGVLAALVTVLVNSVSVTYFIGTTRWCREVVEEYGLDTSLFERSRALKRRTYPWALTGVFVILGIICLGAASDPGANGGNSSDWVTIHFMASILGTAAIAWAFAIQVRTVGRNYDIIQEILEQVNTIRGQQLADVQPVVPASVDEGAS